MAFVISEQEGFITTLTLSRPKALNALNEGLLSELLSTIESVDTAKTRVVILTGDGEKSFVAGADIAVMADYDSAQISEYLELGQRVMRAIERCPVPVLAAVNGFALGGGLELALSCDLIFSSDAAKFGQPEVGLGIVPGFGATQRLIWRCGIGTAKKLIYTGELIGASEAQRIHLIDGIFTAETLRESVKEIAQSISQKAPLAVQASKEIINGGIKNNVLSGLRIEVEGFLQTFNTADRKEGMKAFLEKRAPHFISQ